MRSIRNRADQGKKTFEPSDDEQKAKSGIAGLLVRVDVPDDVVGQAEDFVARALGHLCESFGFGLVLECVTREVDAWGDVSILLSRSSCWQ